MGKVKVNKEIALALDTLSEMCAGFHHEMYCVMNKYIFNQTSNFNPLLEPLRKSNLFDVVDAIRYGYIILDDTNTSETQVHKQKPKKPETSPTVSRYL